MGFSFCFENISKNLFNIPIIKYNLGLVTGPKSLCLETGPKNFLDFLYTKYEVSPVIHIYKVRDITSDTFKIIHWSYNSKAFKTSNIILHLFFISQNAEQRKYKDSIVFLHSYHLILDAFRFCKIQNRI